MVKERQKKEPKDKFNNMGEINRMRQFYSDIRHNAYIFYGPN